jgi:glutathione S-transferase
MDDPVPIVWGVGTSRTMRVHWTLCELGIDYESREIITRTETMDDPAFLAISRRGKIPILEHGGLVIGESGAIVNYLADRYTDRIRLAPTPSTQDRARFDEMCFFILMELDAPLYVIRRHKGLPEIYGESQTAVDAAEAYFLRQTGMIEEWLASEGPYLMGPEFCSADLLLGTCSVWAQFVGIKLCDALVHHLALVQDREGFRQARERNFPPAAMAALAKSL